MGVVFRQSIKNSLVIFAGALLGTLIIWLSTHYIRDKQMFGYTKTLTQQAVTLSLLVLLGFNNTMGVFVHRYAHQEKKRKLMLTLCFGLPLIVMGVVTIGYCIGKEWILKHFQPADIPLMREYFYWLPLYTLLFMYMVIFEQYLGSQMKVAVSAFMREVLVRVMAIVLLLLFAFDYISFHSLVVGTVLIYIVPVAIFYFLSVRTEQFGYSLQFGDMEPSDYREMFHFSWYHFLLTASIILLSSMDLLLLPFYDHKGLNSVAVYSIAVFLLSFLQMPYKAMYPGSYTVLARAFADNDMPKAQDLFERSSVNMLIPTVFMAVLITCNLPNAVAVISNGYEGLIPVFEILMVGKVFDIATGMNDQVLSVANYYKFNFYVSLVLTLTLFLALKFLVPVMGVNGAALATSLTIIVFNTVKFLFVRRKLGMQPFSVQTLKIVAVGGITWAATSLVPVVGNPFTDCLVRSVVVCILFLFLLLWLQPSADLRAYLLMVRQQKKLF
jgi:O-antigen/teichoic acid export membrane protein